MRALVLACAYLLAVAASAAAAPPPPADLGVDGGQETWRPTRSFQILWTNPVADPPIAAVHYRVRDPAGATVLGPVRLPWAAGDVGGIEVPGPPGAYTVQVWLEDAAGQWSVPASALLRFDNQRPGEVDPSVGAAWIGRAAFPLPVRLSHPAPVPLSGIRGYAVTVSTDPERTPCAAADRCTEAETDLHGGIDGDVYAIADLPEGTSYLRAAAVSGSGVASNASAPLALRVDKTSPNVELRGVPAGWSEGQVTVTATATDGGSGMAVAPGGLPPFTAIAVDDGVPATEPGTSVSATVLGEGVHRVVAYARDLAGNVDDGATSNGVPNPAPRSALVRIDRTPPAVSFAAAQDPAAPELIRARVADSLSGADPGRGWIGVRRRNSGDPYEPLPAVPAPPGEVRAIWSSESYPDGEYEFRAVGFDRAGNATATGNRAGGSAMVLSNPLKERTTLHLGFAPLAPPSRPAASETRLTVDYGREVLLRGQLLAGSGPLASLPVEIVERFGDGATRVSSVRTAADGGFSLALGAGPGREVSATFAGGETLSRATSPSLRLRVRARVTMSTSARVAKVGGRPLLFAGRVSAAPGTIPAEGKTVELQFRLPGLPWTEFRTIRTDWRGRFRYRYRFSDDDSRGVRFLFRAYAPAQGAWPYEPAGSKPVAVRGR
jgi:hypothetical protein